MTIGAASASRIVYGCTGATHDEAGCHYAPGRSIADDHYAQSRVTVADVSDPDVIALLDELEANMEHAKVLAAQRAEWMAQAREASTEADKLKINLEAAQSKIDELTSREPDLYLCRVTRDGEELYSPCGRDYPRGRGYIAAQLRQGGAE